MTALDKTAKISGGYGVTEGDMNKKNYDRSFIHRVRVARESAGLDRAEVAAALGIKQDTYARYEIKIMMPHHLVPRFLQLTGVSCSYLFGCNRRQPPVRLRSV